MKAWHLSFSTLCRIIHGHHLSHYTSFPVSFTASSSSAKTNLINRERIAKLKRELPMEEQVNVPGTHSANEPNKPTAGSDGIEETSDDNDSPSSNIALCDCSPILLRVRWSYATITACFPDAVSLKHLFSEGEEEDVSKQQLFHLCPLRSARGGKFWQEWRETEGVRTLDPWFTHRGVRGGQQL